MPSDPNIPGDNALIACVDVDYRSVGAVTAAVWFRGWAASVPECTAVVSIPEVAEYVPGAFYRRELPCLLEVLSRGPRAEIVVVDGYVWLGKAVAGLGAHLHNALGCAVVGVAKTRYASDTDAVEVRRGDSSSPLFVSAVGIPVEEAAANVVSMAGPFRIPTLIKEADQLARNSLQEKLK
jgi:deoxyribonuclease V